MQQDNTDKVTRLVVFAFWSVVLVGLPFWWKTTEVYRASLPFDEIDTRYQKQACDFVMPTQLTIFVPPQLNKQEQIISDIKRQLSTHSRYKDQFPIDILIKEWIGDVVEGHDEAPIGDYFIYVNQAEKDTLYVGSERSSQLSIKDMTLDRVTKAIATLITPIYLNKQENLGNIACHVEGTNKNDVASMRALKYSSQYGATISLMNNNPEHMRMDWDIRDAINAYFTPFIKAVSTVSNLTITSQIQNYAPLSLKPKYKEREGKPNYYYFEPQHLPHFVNSAEWNLASTITSYPSIHFILYVPSADESPLRIHDAKGQPLLTSAFLIPRWGSVVIKNPPRNATGEYRFTKQDLQPIIKIFVSQLRSLIGVQDMESHVPKQLVHDYQVTFAPATHTGITTLEKDNLIRTRTLENVVNTISTLKSLAQLVDEIPNMVVQDHISDKVHHSLNALDLVDTALRKRDYLNALQNSIEAIELAEKAFFDPTMVSMLYFPDEHKYAIYMPLFVPISVPLMMALLKEIKKLKQAKTLKQKEE
ncbi:phosphatidylinositol-glycan biosynthesis class S protein [Gilbertella persicaria]|uniref:phosphatidylinositol-glycan biosynthesis class S protein n=1 Tax=Gilbertella persicaria TaxID=101096 RepID=UPI0022207A30|nr:phosphatidylinositol-glycan biosynthesis class S protein [Gilbertella persicaria]KAI8084218.1 phosphatidylinositol-glycan biosynthesis class S protein [Gilbertella persicaria]